MENLDLVTSRFPTSKEGDLERNNGAPGSQFAEWVKSVLQPHGYLCDAVIQEDYGWGFWVIHNGLDIWVCVGHVEGETEDEPFWGISVNHDAPFKINQWFRAREGKRISQEIMSVLRQAVLTQPDMRIVES